jgi:membrane protein
MSESAVAAPEPGAGPDSPTRLGRHALMRAIRGAIKEFGDDNVSDWAAALTYYSVLSIFPGLLVIVSLVGLIHHSTTGPLISNLTAIAPGPVRTIIQNAVASPSRGAAGFVAVLSLIVGIWSASGYIGAFMRAANAIYDVPEGRPVWKTIPVRLGVTILIGVLLVASATIVVVSGNIAAAVGRSFGAGSAAVTAWGIAKWPVLVVLVAVMFAVLYRAAPNARQGGWRWVTPGGVLAVVLWVAASALFGVYVANFASYNKTYGTLAGAVVFLVWLWLSNLAVLFGAELDAELERQRAVAAGHPPDREPYLRLRDDRKVARGSSDRSRGLGGAA